MPAYTLTPKADPFFTFVHFCLCVKVAFAKLSSALDAGDAYVLCIYGFSFNFLNLFNTLMAVCHNPSYNVVGRLSEPKELLSSARISAELALALTALRIASKTFSFSSRAASCKSFRADLNPA